MSLMAALALAALPLIGHAPAWSCPHPPPPGDSQDVVVGHIEFGDNNSSGVHAGYVSPGGGAYVFVGLNDDGAQIWAGAAGMETFVGAGPGYANFNEVCAG